MRIESTRQQLQFMPNSGKKLLFLSASKISLNVVVGLGGSSIGKVLPIIRRADQSGVLSSVKCTRPRRFAFHHARVSDMSFRLAPRSRSHVASGLSRLSRRPYLESMESRLAPAAIVGSVFFDANGDGIRETTEPGMSGVTVYLDLNANGKFDAGPGGDVSTKTGVDGRYVLTTTAVGTFDVLQVVPPGFTQTTNDPTAVTLPGPTSPNTTPIPGPTFGNKVSPTPPPTGGVIHGTVFNDLNGDGMRETNEPGQGGVLVFIDVNGDGNFNPGTTANSTGEPFVISAPDGGYEFHVSKDGSYSVLEVVPQGFAMTTPAPTPVTVAGGASVAGPLFGNQLIPPPPPPTGGVIHGTVFVDINGDGMRETNEPGQAGVLVFIDVNGDGKYTPGPTPTSPGEPSVISGPDGGYTFHVGKDGSYSVLEVVPPGFTMTTAAPAPVTVAGGATVAGPDFGNHPNPLPPPPPPIGYITGEVFLDANSNGNLDPNEHGMGGIRVYDDANGNGKFDAGERYTISGKTGRYALVLPAGSHSIQEVVPAGFTQTSGPGTVTIVAGQGLVGQNIGNAPGPTPFGPLTWSPFSGYGDVALGVGVDGMANGSPGPSTNVGTIQFLGGVLI
jgi:serine-aspartate repeat-containing protein C/D/E